MKTIAIKELTVPLDEYATVSEDATLSDAIVALERAQQAFDHTKYRYRAIIVIDKSDSDPVEAQSDQHRKIGRSSLRYNRHIRIGVLGRQDGVPMIQENGCHLGLLAFEPLRF